MEDELGGNLAKSIKREMCEVTMLIGVKIAEAAGSEGAAQYGGVKDVEGGFHDGALGGIVITGPQGSRMA
jgi:hypothetical protein